MICFRNPQLTEHCTWLYRVGGQTGAQQFDYLYWVLSQEIEMRQEAAMAKREKESKLPYKEFLKSRVNEGIAWQIDRLESLQWIDEFQNLIIIGECDK